MDSHSHVINRNPMKTNSFSRFAASIAVLFLPLCNLLQAQTSLNLTSATVAAAGTAQLSLSLASSSSSPLAAIQWTLDYSPTAVAGVSVTAGPASAAAGKTVSCNAGAGSYKCVAWGANGTTIQDGVLATVSVTLAGGVGVPVNMSNTLAASAAGDLVAVTGVGGTIAVVPVTTVSSIACVPGALGPGTSGNCTVILSGTGGGTVGLSSSSSDLTVPTSLAIPAGSGRERSHLPPSPLHRTRRQRSQPPSTVRPKRLRLPW